MKMLRVIILSLATCLFGSYSIGQGLTSSGINGRVTSNLDDPLAGVKVTAIHEPTGSVFSSETNSSGQYFIQGMRVGGPYTVTYEGDGGLRTVLRGINLNLQQERVLNVQLESEQVFELEAFEVFSSDFDIIFNEGKQGSGSVINSEELNRLPTVDRSLNDIVRLDPRMSVFDKDNGTISAGGKNFRYNTLLIDGVPTNDSFGLSDSGLPALKQPFSLESIAEISVQISPYSVENAGFTGASISAVTKSGSNEFTGSVFAFYRNTSMVGDLYDSYIEPGETEPELVPFQDFLEYTAGFTFGGPIIKNKLFFFALYERVEETLTRDPGDFYPRQDELDRILKMVENDYNFDPGTLDDPGDQRKSDDKYLLKLDWNISEKHRLSARYQLTKGSEPNYPGYSGDSQIAFSSHFYDQIFQLNDLTAELFSSWTSTFKTEFLISQKKYKQEREPASQLPAIQISSVDGVDGGVGTVWMGTHATSQFNRLNVDTTVMRFKASLLVGDHSIRAGVQYEHFDNYNAYIPRLYGDWFFRNGVASFEGAVDPGAVETYSILRPTEGNTGIADWDMAIASAFIEDNWKISTRFNLNLGLRIDYPLMDSGPPEARGSVENEVRSFSDIFGYENTGTVDGNYVIQPRIGFNYAFDEERKTQVRGGAGLFFGTAPHVWISSIFINNGVSQEFFRASTSNTPAFSPDTENPPIPPAVNSRVNVDSLNADFKMPTEWKGNLALDRKLPWGISGTLEIALTKTAHDIRYIHHNLRQVPINFRSTGFLPDGRTIYDNQQAKEREVGYRDVIELVNTREGFTRQYTVLLSRPVPENGFGFRGGYTYTKARNLNDGRSAGASSNWTNNVGFDPNDEVLGRSRFETKHRFVVTGTYKKKWTDRNTSSITLVYEGRSGRPFSFVFGRDRNSTDINLDQNSSNDLVYVPTGIDDPLVLWGDPNNSKRDTIGVAFMELVGSTSGLSKYKGRVVPRNSGTSPWIHQVDLNITHEIRLWNDHKLELIFAIENLTNLINENWGRERRPRGPGGNVPIVGARARPAFFAPEGTGNENGVYIYNADISDFDQANWYEVRNFSSRWAAQVGVRYSF
jgi:hypothetical protein